MSSVAVRSVHLQTASNRHPACTTAAIVRMQESSVTMGNYSQATKRSKVCFSVFNCFRPFRLICAHWEAKNMFTKYFWCFTLKTKGKQRIEEISWALIMTENLDICCECFEIEGVFIGVTSELLSVPSTCAFSHTSLHYDQYHVSFFTPVSYILSSLKSSIIVSGQLNGCICNQNTQTHNHTYSFKASSVSVRFCERNLWFAASAQSPAPNHRGRKLSKVGWRCLGASGSLPEQYRTHILKTRWKTA